MKDHEKTKEQLVKELMELRSQNATLEKTRKELAVIKIAADEASELAENVINTVREPLIVLGQDLRVVKVSSSFYDFFKVRPEETVGQLIYDLGNRQWDIPKLRELLETILPEKATFDNYEVEHDFTDIGRRTMLLNARQIQRVLGKERGILLAIEDITEHKRLEDLLKEAEGRYRHVFETARDGIVLFEKREGKITHANQAVRKMLGYSLEECVGKKLLDIGIVDIDDFQTLMQILDEIGITNYTNVPIKTKSGQHIDTDIYLADRAKLVQCNIRDISQRKQAERELSESEKQYRTLFNAIDEGFCIIEVIFDENEKPIDYRFIEINPSFEKQTGLIDAKGKRMRELAPKHEEHWFEIYGKIAVTGQPARFVNRAEQLHCWYDVYAFRVGQPENRQVAILFNDITDRKQTERLDLLARNVLEILNQPEDSTGTIRSILHLIKKSLDFQAVGIRLKEVEDYPYYETSGFSEDFLRVERYLCAYDEEGKIVRDSNGNSVLECMCGNIISRRTDASLPFFTKGGSFWTNSTTDLLASTTEKDRQTRTRNRCNVEGYESVALIPLQTGDEIIGLLQLNDRRRDMFTLKLINFFEYLGSSIGIALTRKRTEDGLKEALEKYRSLAAYVDSMYLVDRDCTYLFMNERHLKRFGLPLGEVVGKKYSAFHSEEDSRQFVEYIAEVCKTGKESTQEHRSERDGRYFLRSFTPIIGQSRDGSISQVAVIAKDITIRKLAESNLQETLESLRKAVGTTVQVLVSAVESRDPYTSGHQTRSADLSRAIATELGLSQDKIDGIRMAGSIHDVGKLSIPAEILSKPTKLTEIEFSLIKEHSRKGYEMLKDVESQWPLAEIVYQHHERIDGSGYPRKLTGDDILIEARILAVADVVESMAYRAGMGIDAALAEIENNKGTLYDADAVDSCLRLFKEKGYKM